MHILVTNDDGPPSTTASPYILPFVQLLEQQGHTVSVILPNVQRSWIGKAHIVGQEIHSTEYWPPPTTPAEHDETTTNNPPPPQNPDTPTQHPWILLDSTPATCIQIGIAHFFTPTRGAIDLIISGPNFGRNTTAVFALSSGTLGAALEAAVCGFRAVALSFAFFDRNHDPDVIREACAQGVRVCEWLARHAAWGHARLYSVNVPVKAGVAERRVVWTRMLQNQWKKGACFQEVEEEGVEHPNVEEEKLRRQESGVEGGGGAGGAGGSSAADLSTAKKSRQFKWAPRFTDVFDSVEKAGPGSDGWTVKAGETSVTAIHANFHHAEGHEGEIDLSADRSQTSNM